MASTSVSTENSLIGKVALVSGSSSGIGAAIARELSRRGANVIVHYRSEGEKSQAEEVFKSLPGISKAFTVEADLSTLDGPRRLADACGTEFGRIDILVNNAGISEQSVLDCLDDKEIENTWDKIINVNGRGTLLLTRAVLKYLSPIHSRIINICSSTSRRPDPDMTIYAGSKGMIESFTRCWAVDLPHKYGCTVNAVAPGPVATEHMLNSPEDFLATIGKVIEQTPASPRMAKPEEVAWTVAVLCEEGASWLNGLYIPVAGGLVFS